MNYETECPYLIGVDPESYKSETLINPVDLDDLDLDPFLQLTSLLHINTNDYPGVCLEGVNIHLTDSLGVGDSPAYVACNFYLKLMKRKCVDCSDFPTFPIPTILRHREVQGGDLQTVRQQLHIVSMNKILTNQPLDEINVTGTEMDESGHIIGNKRRFSDDRCCDSIDNERKNQGRAFTKLRLKLLLREKG